MSTPHLLAGFIGINRHLDPGISELSCTHRDATARWALWQDTLPNTAPVQLVDEEASCARIQALLAQTLDAATENDTVLLTFSGHGTHGYHTQWGQHFRKSIVYRLLPRAQQEAPVLTTT